MRKTIFLTFLPILLIVSSGCGQISKIEDLFSELKGPYLGQKNPGMQPEVFAPDIFGFEKYEVHDCPVFSPEGKEMYWGLMNENSQSIRYIKQVDGVWSKPEKITFKSKNKKCATMQPILSPDGQKLFVLSYCPPKDYYIDNGGNKWRDYIWVFERQGNDWINPEPVDSIINTLSFHWQFSVAANGNLYVSHEGDIYSVPRVDGRYQAPVKLSSAVNSELRDGMPFITPDESILIFSRLDADYRGDLYVSFRQDDSLWTKAVSLGNKINSPSSQLCPNLTPDGKYLFYLDNVAGFTRPYWVDARIVYSLRPEKAGTKL